MEKKLYRSSADRIISGVLGGLAEYLNISSAILRILFVILAIFGDGFFLLGALYLLGAIFIPLNPVSYSRPGNERPFGDKSGSGSPFSSSEGFTDTVTSSKNKQTVGISLILLGLFFLASTVFAVAKEYIIAVVLILLGIYIIFRYDKGGN